MFEDFQYQSAPRIEANNYFGKHWGKHGSAFDNLIHYPDPFFHQGADILLAARHQNLELYESHAAPAVFFGSDFGIDFGDIRDIRQSFKFPVSGLCLEIGLILTLHILVFQSLEILKNHGNFFPFWFQDSYTENVLFEAFSFCFDNETIAAQSIDHHDFI